MVRFIIYSETYIAVANAKIYIPIWLDLLFRIIPIWVAIPNNLHSNMVRFIILKSI